MTHKGRTRLKTPAAHQPQTHFADCKFTSGGDPIELGFVSSLSQPGGNVTGVSFLSNELGAKRLELLRELVPAATSVGFLANPTRPSFQSEVKDAQQAAQALGVKLADEVIE